jgi:hypothetical protein
MSWHYYCWGVYVGTEEPYDPVTKWFCDTLMGPGVFETVKLRRAEVGGGSFLTEVQKFYHFVLKYFLNFYFTQISTRRVQIMLQKQQFCP